MKLLKTALAAAAIAVTGGAASASTVIQGFSTYGSGNGAIEDSSFLYTPTMRNNGQCAPDDTICLNEKNGGSTAGTITYIYETNGAGTADIANVVNNGFSYMGQYLNFNGSPPSAGNFYQVTGYDYKDTGGGAFDYVAGQVVNFDTTRTYSQYKSAYAGIKIYREDGTEMLDGDKFTFQSGGFFITYGSLFADVDRIFLFGQDNGGQSRSDCLATDHDTGVSFGSITSFNGCVPSGGGGGGGGGEVPVPASLPLLAGGLGLAGFWVRRRKSAS